MTDYTELNAKAESAISELSDLNQDWPTDGDYFDCQSGPEFEYLCAANPVVIKALIAENEALRKVSGQCLECNDTGEIRSGLDGSVVGECHKCYAKDAKRYRWLRQYTVDSYGARGSFKSLDRDIDASMGQGEQS